MNPILIACGFGVLAWLVTKLNLSPNVQVTGNNAGASGAPAGNTVYNNAAPILPPNQAADNARRYPWNPNSNRADVPDAGARVTQPSYLTSNVPADRDLDKATRFMGLRDPNEGKTPASGCGCGDKDKGCGCNSTAPPGANFPDGAGGCMASSQRSLLRAIARCNPNAFQSFENNISNVAPHWGEGDNFTVHILPTGKQALGAVARGLDAIATVFGDPEHNTADPNTLAGGGRSTQQQLSDYLARQTQDMLALESAYFNPPQNAQPVTIWNANR